MSKARPPLTELAASGSPKLKRLLREYPTYILKQADETTDPCRFLLQYEQQRHFNKSNKLACVFSPETLDRAGKSDDPMRVLREDIIRDLPKEAVAVLKDVKDEDFGKVVISYLVAVHAKEDQQEALKILKNKYSVFPMPADKKIFKHAGALETLSRTFKMQALDKLTFESLEFPEHYQAKDPWLRAVDTFIFYNLDFVEERDLSNAIHYLRIKLAAMNNDHQFFKRLGRALSEPPTKTVGISPLGKLECLMTAWWTRRDEAPGLCWFTDGAMTDLFRLLFGNTSLQLDAVRKTRQRLKLRRVGKPHITQVKKVKGKIIVASKRWTSGRT